MTWSGSIVSMLPDDYNEPNKSGIGVNGNLKPVVAGEVRNPNGRPKGSKNRATIAKEMAKIMLEGQSLAGETKHMTAEELMIATLWRKAFSGDMVAIKEVQDTLHGKIADKTELTGKDGEPLNTGLDQKALDHYALKRAKQLQTESSPDGTQSD